MEPISGFATIVALLSDFNASRRGAAAATVEEFKSWLAENRHSQIVDSLEQNAASLRSIKTLLHEDRRTLGAQFQMLDQQLAKLASGLELFKPLASALRPGGGLSGQALEWLEQLDSAGASKFLKGGGFSGTYLAMIDGSGKGNMTISEPRFVESDLDDLLELGLVKGIGTNGRSELMYAFSRSAAALVKARRDSVREPLE
ncbi:MAG TPA: hypothetical protein VFQ84_09190 [Arenimonas sp.]|uniref:hypothetical protein n=1 Tax=Arenimonas sp. TaxID=1872635 RepID=UPI002D8091E9|nr:hypothetical protein [Arenimonas sp.]HEU0153505.1 hypothetical protein [Arenimonas sp.]